MTFANHTGGDALTRLKRSCSRSDLLGEMQEGERVCLVLCVLRHVASLLLVSANIRTVVCKMSSKYPLQLLSWLIIVNGFTSRQNLNVVLQCTSAISDAKGLSL